MLSFNCLNFSTPVLNVCVHVSVKLTEGCECVDFKLPGGNNAHHVIDLNMQWDIIFCNVVVGCFHIIIFYACVPNYFVR